MYWVESFDIVFGAVQLSTLRYSAILDFGCRSAFFVIEIMQKFVMFVIF